MPIEESTILLAVIWTFIGALLKVLFDLDHHILELKSEISNQDPSHSDELNAIKETLSELKGMINIMAQYQKILRPPGGEKT